MTNHYPNEQDALANLRRKYEDLEAERDKLKGLLKKTADELEDEINARYPEYTLGYPNYVQKKKNDMETVLEARAALGETEK